MGLRKYLLFIIFVLFLAKEGFSQKKVDSTLWCFSWNFSNQALAVAKINQLSFTYLTQKNKKWKRVAPEKLFWGYQPEISCKGIYQVSLPKSILSIEATFYVSNQKYSILIDEIPDSLSKYPLVYIDELKIEGKQNQYSYRQLTNLKVSKFTNCDLIPLVKINDQPRIQTDQTEYQINAPMKIYVEASENQPDLILSGCGTPGTLYVLQQWLNGAWVEYQNTWSLKCVQQKFKVNRYIVGLSVNKKGIYRVVFDDILNNNINSAILISNPFEIK